MGLYKVLRVNVDYEGTRPADLEDDQLQVVNVEQVKPGNHLIRHAGVIIPIVLSETGALTLNVKEAVGPLDMAYVYVFGRDVRLSERGDMGTVTYTGNESVIALHIAGGNLRAAMLFLEWRENTPVPINQFE